MIRPNIARLEALNLSQEEKYAIRYINYNPHALVIFDDASSEVQELVKIGKTRKGREEYGPVIENFFYKGRHAYITHMYTCHDVKLMDAELRKNAFNVIFTDKATASSFFENKTNQFTSEERKRAQAIIDEIFSDKHEKTFKKLIYTRHKKQKLHHISAEEHESFTMGSRALWEYSDQIRRKDEHFDKSNPHMQSFGTYIQ